MSDALSKAALFWVAAAALQRSRGLQEIRLRPSNPHCSFSACLFIVVLIADTRYYLMRR